MALSFQENGDKGVFKAENNAMIMSRYKVSSGSPVALDYHERTPFKFNGNINGFRIRYTGSRGDENPRYQNKWSANKATFR